MRQTTGGGPTLGQSSRTIRGDMGAVDETLTAEAADQAIIRTEGLTKVYAGADFTAVDHLDLNIQAGEIFGLLGPNGAGKTTTAGMLTTRIIPSAGSAFIGAVDVIANPALAKQMLGIVSQQNTLDRQLTVWENLYYHGRLFGDLGRRVASVARDELLDRFKLKEWARVVGVRALRRDGAAAHGRARDPPPAARFCSWTSRRRASIRRAASRSGTYSASSTATAKRSRSSRTTWRRRSISAIASRSWITARSSRSTHRRRSGSQSEPTRSSSSRRTRTAVHSLCSWSGTSTA